MIRRLCCQLLCCLLLGSCIRTNENTVQSTIGYVPVYASAASVDVITKLPARNIERAGKIYVYGNYLFQNEFNKGVHIIDISDRSNPVKRAFISIPYSTELAVKGSFLYVNNLNDLVTLNISDPLNPVVTNRVKDAFPTSNQQYPPYFDTYFECPDPSKGVVVDWVQQTIENPKCRR